MLSHLCKVTPFWFHKKKLEVEDQVPCNCLDTGRLPVRRIQEYFCDFLHCPSCDKRECCIPLETCYSSNDTSDSKAKVINITENPAYGLDPETIVSPRMEVFSNNVIKGPNSEVNKTISMSFIQSRYLESIPEDNDIQHSTLHHPKSNMCFPLETPTESPHTCDTECDNEESSKLKVSVKEKSFTLSLIKPHVKLNEQKYGIVPQTKNETKQTRVMREDSNERCQQKTLDKRSKPKNLFGQDHLLEMASVKTEENIHEWLARISDWVDSNSRLPEEDLIEAQQSPEEQTDKELPNYIHFDESRLPNDEKLQEIATSTKELLSQSTKDTPANIPMVVMQCSRLHSHIVSKPPFKQSSLPMGSLVTALYKESQWLYIQTPHGLEGFIKYDDCAPIGTTMSQHTKRPWEPCDFPIQVHIKNYNFGRQHGGFIPATFPTYNGKKFMVNMVNLESTTNNEKYLNNTLKGKDSIKTAKTVTDILQNLADIQINNK